MSHFSSAWHSGAENNFRRIGKKECSGYGKERRDGKGAGGDRGEKAVYLYRYGQRDIAKKAERERGI